MRLGVRGAAKALIVAVALAGLAACSSTGSGTTNPYDTEIERVLAQVTSEFQRGVLEDHIITREEYDEASSLFLRCLEDKGYNVSREWQNAYYIYAVSPGGSGADAAHQECVTEYLDPIEPLFIATTTNPENKPWNEAVVECLVRIGAAPAGFTLKEYNSLGVSPDASPNDPGDLFRDSDAVIQCSMAPNIDAVDENF